MAMVDADWSIDRATGNIRYEGDDHTLNGGTPSYATVIQFHRWLQEFADDEAFTNDDELDIIDKNPSNRSTDNYVTLVNGFNVDATAIEHLYDGTIVQGSGITEERWDGIVNFGNPSVQIQILQDGAVIADDYWNYGYEADTATATSAVLTDSGETWTTNEWVGYTVKNVTDGSQCLCTENDGTTITGVLYGGTADTWTTGDTYHIGKPLNPDAAQGISSRFMIKTRENGVDIDRRRLVGTNRRYYNTYGEFKINGTSLGNNVLALSDSTDLNNTTAWATIDAIVDVTNTEGLRTLDIGGDGTADEEYYSEWTRGAQTINTFYEHMKADSMDSTGVTLNGQNGELHRGVTHSVAYDTETGVPAAATNDKFVYGTYVNTGAVTGGPFVVGEVVRETGSDAWRGRVLSVDGTDTSLIVDIRVGTVGNTEAMIGDTSGATATTSAAPTGEEIQNAAGEFALFAIDDDGATGNFYGQITKGVGMLNNTRLYDPADHTDYYTCSAASAEIAVSTPFVGVSTGSALIAAIGFGMVASDAAAADTFFSLNNPSTAVTPPNNVTFTASGFISGDRVLCTNDNGGDIDFTQMAIATTALTGVTTTVEVNAIPVDCPSSGTIRIQRDDGLYSRHPFSARDLGTDQFTITSHDFTSNNASISNNCFISYLDLETVLTEETFSYVYNADRTHFLRVRDGAVASPIKTAETTGVMSTTGGTASVNRIDDI